MTTKEQRKFGFIGGSIIAAVLALSFGVLFFTNHAWGAWGDDSPGYTFLAARLTQGEPLVYQDELAARGLAYFEDEKLARWLTPTHHQFINTDGVIASKYPIGLSLLLAAGIVLTGSVNGMYLVVPLLAVVNIVLTFFLIVVLLRNDRYQYIIASLAAIGLGVTSLYMDYALSQPMREIPSLTFLLTTLLLFIWAVRAYDRNSYLPSIAATIGAGLAFGMAFNIRETSAVIAPALIVYAVAALWHKNYSWQTNLKRVLAPAGIFVISTVIAVIPTILNSAAISAQKEVFKARDTSETVLLSNIGHLQTLSVNNILASEGKFRPATGSAQQYWEVIQGISPLPFFVVLVIVGIGFYWKRSRSETALIGLWALGILLIFSMWINPYSRYIIPAFPALFFFAAYGLIRIIDTVIPSVFSERRWQWLATGVVIAAAVIPYQPVLADLFERSSEPVAEQLRNKAISREDNQQLVTVATLAQTQGENAVVLFSGNWQYGISETLQAHTQVKTIRFPFEQRFEFDEEYTWAFIDEIVQEQPVLFWADSTSTPQALQTIDRYQGELLQTLDFTFQDGVQLYRLSK